MTIILGDISLTSITVKFAAALALIIFGIIAGIIAEKLVRRLLHGFELDKVLASSGMKFPLEDFIASVCKYMVYFSGIILALGELGLSTLILEILLGVIAVIIVALIILAFKDFVPNITAGLFMHRKGNMRKGDWIKVNEIEGEVIEFDLIETKIKMKSGNIILIPNSFLAKNVIMKKKA